MKQGTSRLELHLSQRPPQLQWAPWVPALPAQLPAGPGQLLPELQLSQPSRSAHKQDMPHVTPIH